MPFFLAGIDIPPLFNDVIVILLLSVGVTLVASRLKLPSIIGYLLTGVLASPGVLGLVSATKEVEILAEIGVILLMFTIGLEFSIASLARIRKALLLGGGLQVGLTTLVVTWVSMQFGLPLEQAIFLGFLLSFSSTAIVLKLLQDRMEMEAPHGRIVLAILIFQDIIVVPMMLVTPMLGGQTDDLWTTVGILVLKVLGVLALVVLGAKYLMPRLLEAVVRTRSRELFLLTVVASCLGVAWFTSLAGLSLALGAFMAGLIISESEYSYEAVGNVLPFRDIFASFFFVSIGMLLDVQFLMDHPLMVLAFALAVFLLKVVLVSVAVWALKVPMRTVLMTAFSLFQVGEFAFILAIVGIQHNVLEPETYQYFLSMSILTMSATPFVMMAAERMTKFALSAPVPQAVRDRLRRTEEAQLAPEQEAKLKDHLVVIGYGLNGRNLVRAAKQAQIPYVIIEMNGATVQHEKSKGEPIVFGDAANDHVLDHVHIDQARVVVVAISDPMASRSVVSIIRHMNPTACILVRTRYVKEIDSLLKIGATEVIPEELETSIEIFSRVLAKYLVPVTTVDRFVRELRSDTYEMLRTPSLGAAQWANMHFDLSSNETATFEIAPESAFVGHSLAALDLRRKFGINLLAIRRVDGTTIYEVAGDTQLQAHDVLYVFGHYESVRAFAAGCIEAHEVEMPHSAAQVNM
jgi:CPA2 family monovalent cation:H+ antiporter-2